MLPEFYRIFVKRMIPHRSVGWLCYSVLVVSAAVIWNINSTLYDFKSAGATSTTALRTDGVASLCEYLSLACAASAAALSAWLLQRSVVQQAELIAQVHIHNKNNFIPNRCVAR